MEWSVHVLKAGDLSPVTSKMLEITTRYEKNKQLDSRSFNGYEVVLIEPTQ